MSDLSALARLLAEGLRVTRASLTTSVVIGLMTAGVCIAVLGTTGQTAAADAAVLSTLDTPNARVVMVTDEQGKAAIDPRTLDFVRDLPGVESVIGLGPSVDYRPIDQTQSPNGEPVAVSRIYGQSAQLVPGPGTPRPGAVLLGAAARERLAWTAPAGALMSTERDSRAVVGGFTTRPPLDFLASRGLLWPDAHRVRTVGAPAKPTLSTIVVLVRDSATVPHVASLLPGVIIAETPSVTITTSEDLVAAHRAVASTVAASSRTLMLFVLAASLVLLTITLYGATSAKARDFGRRRALGASQSAIVVLVLTQTVVPAAAGALVGSVGGLALVHRLAGQLPPAGFTVGVAALTVLAACVAAVLPGLLAATRDPVRILRIP